MTGTTPKTEAQSDYRARYYQTQEERDELSAQNMQLREQINAMEGSISWRLTRPMRILSEKLRRLISYIRDGRRSFTSIFGLLSALILSLSRKLWQRSFAGSDTPEICPPAFGCNKREYIKRRGEATSAVKISILVPLYNTPEQYLRELTASVKYQTFQNWELCFADGSDDGHAYVSDICLFAAQKDNRVRYRKLPRNLGISDNTNACIEMSTGDYLCLLDHDDLLHPYALAEVEKAIREQGADFIYTDENTFSKVPSDAYCPNYKPDYAPDTLRSYNYICHLSAFSRELLTQCGRFDGRYDGSQDYDLILRLTESAQRIVHIPKVLYYWRASECSTASGIEAKPYTLDAARRALKAHLERVGLKGQVEDSKIPSTYKISYDIVGQPLVSIIIPNRDHSDILRRCIDSILERTTYHAFEILIAENNSAEQATYAYYRQLEDDPRIRVVRIDGKFNYSRVNNQAAKQAQGDYLLLLNNDVEVISPNWLQEMLMFAQRSDVGAVGSMLYYPTGKIQHAGVIMGIGGVAGHSHKYFPRGSNGFMSRLTIAQNLSAVTGACMMLPKPVFNELNGLDEDFELAFNDIDLCMRLREAGYLVVWTPYAELYHYESESRGPENTPEKIRRFKGETARFKQRWGAFLDSGDPYYNPNLTLEREDFSPRRS